MRRPAAEGDAGQHARGNLGGDRRRQVVGHRDRWNGRQLEHFAGQDASDPSTDVTHIRRPGCQQLVVEGGQDGGRGLGRSLDGRDRLLACFDAPDCLVQEAGVGGHQRLRLEDLGLLRAAEILGHEPQAPPAGGLPPGWRIAAVAPRHPVRRRVARRAQSDPPARRALRPAAGDSARSGRRQRRARPRSLSGGGSRGASPGGLADAAGDEVAQRLGSRQFVIAFDRQADDVAL